MTAVLSVLAGIAAILLLTAMTGYFVAQEFAYMSVDRSRLMALSAAGDARARRALRVTGRTSFMLSGAQLGITVTGIMVGYVAEPLIGGGLAGLPGGVVAGTIAALVFSTAVQMVFGELFPKNLAIARPDALARGLAASTTVYLWLFGWLIWLFDHAANLLLRLIRIEPVHDVEHAATERDLEHIIAASRDSGQLPADLSAMLDRVLDFADATAGHAMIPRTRVAVIDGDEPVERALGAMAASYSRLPVLGRTVDDVIGVIELREVLDAEARDDLASIRVRELARPVIQIPITSPLPTVLDRFRETGDEFACVVDEYGGLAGVLTVEDIAEELVGEITDEHDPTGSDQVLWDGDGRLVVPGGLHIDEAERLLGHDLPSGDYETISGFVLALLGRVPDEGDTTACTLPATMNTGSRDDQPPVDLTLTVLSVERHVPHTVRLTIESGGAVRTGGEGRWTA